jgi:protein involved in polysaccharide export with SLBB domain
MGQEVTSSVLGVVALILCFPGTAQAARPQQPETPASATAVGAADEAYRLGVGDVLDVAVSRQPDYSLNGIRVGNDGTIRIARDDAEVVAACRTVREVAEEIKGRYKRYLRNPYVYVSVKEYNSLPVAIIGAVNAPGQFRLQRPVRLLELLTLANGPAPVAGRTIQLVRSPDGPPCPATVEGRDTRNDDPVIIFDLEATLRGDATANPYLVQGDVVRLPEADRAYVVGSVRSPREIALKGPMTLTEAIAAAGGLAPDASEKKVRILRRLPDSIERTEIVANLAAISRREASDVLLRGDDIVDVPGPSAGRKFWGAFKQVLIPASLQYPVRVIR